MTDPAAWNQPQDAVPRRASPVSPGQEPMPVIGPDGIRPPEALGGEPTGALVPRPVHGEVSRPLPPPEKTLVAVFGDCTRRGRFTVGAGTTAVSVFGDVVIDLREAILERDQVAFRTWSMFGEVTFIVPPGFDVHVRGFHLFGGTRQELRPNPIPGPADRVVIVHGYGLFDEVKVKTLEVGEQEPGLFERLRRRIEGTGNV